MIKNIPDFLKSEESLIEYLEAAGDFFQETYTEIDGFKYYDDFLKANETQLELAIQSLGIFIPDNLRVDVKRILLRDAISTFIRKGTEDSIIWVLRIIGYRPEIRYGWLASPELMRKGFYKNPITKEITRYNVNNLAYTNLLWGKEVVTSAGTFFEGYTFNDGLQTNVQGPFPIIGERYLDTPIEDPVIKTTYVAIRIDDGPTNIITDPYEGSDGEIYEYTTAEAVKIISDLIDYYLYMNGRPAPVRIVLLSGTDNFIDELTIDDDYVETIAPIQDDMDGDDEISIDEEFQFIGVVDTTTAEIGDPIIIGRESPYVSKFSVIPTYTLAGGQVNELETLTSFVAEQTFNQLEGFSPVIPLRPGTSVVLEIPRDVEVVVYARNKFADSNNIEIYQSPVDSGSPSTIDVVTFNAVDIQDYHVLTVRTLEKTDYFVKSTATYT